MKKPVHTGILGAAAIAASLTCQSGVYSIGPPPLPHQPDEICLMTSTSGTNTCTEWYISTNILDQQPRWDGFSTEAPLSTRQACDLALKHAATEHPDVLSWAVDEVWLSHPPSNHEAIWTSNVWYYSITLKPRDAKFQDHFGTDCTLPKFSCLQMVLLDGTVVPPKTGKRK